MPAAPHAPPFAPIAPESAGMPLYRVVKASLLRSIESGQHPPGSALPSETELALAFGVSIGTLRKAVDELAAEHIVARRQGRGTFVATHTADRFLLQFFPIERIDGRREAPDIEWLSLARARADSLIAKALQLHEGDALLQIESRLRLQGEVVACEQIALSAAVLKGLTEKRLREWHGTLYRLYQVEFGATVVRTVDRARAVGCDRHAARLLGLATSTPVMQLRRVAIGLGEHPLEYRVSTINTAQHELVNQLARARSANE